MSTALFSAFCLRG